MKNWFSKFTNKTSPTFVTRQACLEAQTLKGQMALKDQDFSIASRILHSVYRESAWWFEHTDPTPRLIAMYSASASLYACALWNKGDYVKALETLEQGKSTLATARENYTRYGFSRQQFYRHCIDALNQTLEECTGVNEHAC